MKEFLFEFQTMKSEKALESSYVEACIRERKNRQ